MDRDYEAFISYRHKECNPLAKALHDEFWNTHAINSFRDDEGLHFGDFRIQLIKNNKRSKYLVLLLTPETLDRCNQPEDWITKEISLYLERKKPIIPVKLQGFEFPEKLPEAIEGLREHECRAITCNITDTEMAVRYIAKEARDRMREGWKSESIAECMDRREYLCDNDTVDGYFAASVNRLRNSVFFLIPMLAMVIGYFALCFKVENNALIYMEKWAPISIFLGIITFILYFLEHKKVDDPETGHKILFSVHWMDRSELGALGQVWGWLVGLSLAFSVLSVIVDFGLLIASIFAAHIMFPGTRCEMDTDAMLGVCAYAAFMVIPCMRLIINSVLELCHFINSISARYPKRYLNWKKINKTQFVWRIVGWIILIPAIAVLGGCLLVLKVV